MMSTSNFLELSFSGGIKNIVFHFKNRGLSDEKISEILLNTLNQLLRDRGMIATIENIPIVKGAPIGIDVLLNRAPKEEIVVKPTTLLYQQLSEELSSEDLERYKLVY